MIEKIIIKINNYYFFKEPKKNIVENPTTTCIIFNIIAIDIGTSGIENGPYNDTIKNPIDIILKYFFGLTVYLFNIK